MSKIEVVNRRIDDLVPYARNARTHSPEQIKQIEASLAEYGWTNPILIGPNNSVVAGHARLQAATNLRENKRAKIPNWYDKHLVPTIDLSHLTETQRRAYVLADNRIALNSGWDTQMLALEMGDLGELGVDLPSLGFEQAELDAIFSTLKPAEDTATPPDDFGEYNEDIETEHECPRCGYVFSGGKATRTSRRSIDQDAADAFLDADEADDDAAA